VRERATRDRIYPDPDNPGLMWDLRSAASPDRVVRIFEAWRQRFHARRRAATTLHENARRLEWSRPPGAKIEGAV